MAEMDKLPFEGGSKPDQSAQGIGSSLPQASVRQPRSGQMGNGDAVTPLTAQFVLSALRRWWKVALPCGMLLAIVAVGAVYLTFRPVYQAEAWLRISDSAPYVAFQSREDSRRFWETQMQLMRSPLVLGPVVSQAEIAQVPEIRAQETPIVWLGNQIRVASVGQSEWVKVSFGAGDRAVAARVVNAVVNTYLDFRGREDSEQTQRVIELLEQEKDRRMRDVDSMRKTISELAVQVTGKDPFAPNSRNETQRSHPLADLQAKLVNLEVSRQVLEARLQALEESAAKEQPVEVPEARLNRILDEHPSMRALTAALMEKKKRLEEYQRTLARGDKDPSYQSLAEEIRKDQEQIDKDRDELRANVRASLAERLKEERKDQLARLHSELDDARLMERLLRDREESLWKNVKEATGDTLQLEFKQAELKRSEQVLEMIADRAVKLRTEQRAPARVMLMKKADEPRAPVEWLPYRRMTAAGLAGFCLPLLLAVAWEWFARRVSDARQIEIQARLPVLGEITRLPARSGLAGRLRSRRAAHSLELYEECIDSLRTCLVLSEPLRDMQVVAITSASAGEGKTSVALQLAISIARASGQRVLLIDADMRSPDIHRLLDIRREPGLAEVLSHRCQVREGIVTDWSDSVHVMPAGRLAVSPHKLVGNGALKELFAEVRPLYRYIVVDTPPVLPAAESLVLARAADVCLVCAMYNVSHIDRVRRSCDRLAATGARPVGVVLNGVPVGEYAHHYGAYYAYAHHEAGSEES